MNALQKEVALIRPTRQDWLVVQRTGPRRYTSCLPSFFRLSSCTWCWPRSLKSFIHPITILLTLHCNTFRILALFADRSNYKHFFRAGLLLLFGVVKKNAILQIDHTNQLRARGMERLEAIIRARAIVCGPSNDHDRASRRHVALTISSGPGSGTNRSIGVLVSAGSRFVYC